jgi:protein AFG1
MGSVGQRFRVYMRCHFLPLCDRYQRWSTIDFCEMASSCHQRWLHNIIRKQHLSNFVAIPRYDASRDFARHGNGVTTSNLFSLREFHAAGGMVGFAASLQSKPGLRVDLSPRVTKSSFRVVSTLRLLKERMKSGKLRPDKAQERVGKRLDKLQEVLMTYDNTILFQANKIRSSDSENTDEVATAPQALTGTGDFSVVTNTSEVGSTVSAKNKLDAPVNNPNLFIPRGLYIHGPVGTGKTMLMDSLYEACILSSPDHGQDRTIPGSVKNRIQRFHFHNFLSQVHTRIHHLKEQELTIKGRNFTVDTSLANNPIYRVGLQLASELSVLCLDEFQVTDIADAVILSQLFGVLFQYGTVVVATSNRPPEDLYEGGLNRGYFLPFVDLLKKHCIVHRIESSQDYRRAMASCSSFFITNDSNKLDAILEEVAREVCGTNLDEPQPIELTLGYQRSLVVHRAYKVDEGGVPNVNAFNNDRDNGIGNAMGCFRFEELCDSELGAKDYRAITKAFDIVVLENIPTLDLEGHNRARRFITLIDELYEAKCALVCSTVYAETPMQLFSSHGKSQDAEPPGETAVDTTPRDGDNDAANVMWVDVVQQGGTPVGALASVRELGFAFDRASSRIYEMCSKSWWDRVLNKSA